MYYVSLIASEVLLLAFFAQTHYGFAGSDHQDLICWNSTVSTEKHPYFATVTIDLNRMHWPTHFGVIISDTYVLAATQPPIVPESKYIIPTVHVGADERGKGGSGHKAIKLIKIGLRGELSLFKLRDPIKFGPRAQPIRIVEAGKGAKSNDTVMLTALQQQPYDSFNRRVTEANLTMVGESGCENLLMQLHPDVVRHCGTSLWTYRPNLPCSVWNKSVLILGGRLAGMEAPYNSFAVNRTDFGRSTIHRYFNIANYRGKIRALAGI